MLSASSQHSASRLSRLVIRLDLPRRLIALAATLLMVAVLSLGAPSLATPAEAADPPVENFFVEATGHNLLPPFKGYYDNNGGLTIFGYPLTEAYEENGKLVQYFERARFEWDGSRGQVELGLLGNILYLERIGASRLGPVESTNDRWYFPETGHTLSYGFLSYWLQNGGLPIFGFPISEEFSEKNPTDGQVYTVQYFERARFEYHPELPDPYKVSIGHLGREYAVGIGLPTEKTAPAPAIELVAKGISQFAGSTSDRAHNIALAASKFNGITIPDGAVFSFNNAIGPVTAEAGYAEGWSIIGDRTVRDVGGGICQVATTAYRAAFFSGLEIVARTPHSYRVGWYEPPVGLDATVYVGSTDLKFKNTLGSPIYVTTFIDNATKTLTFSFYGKKPDYTIELEGPYTSNPVAHGPDRYEYDPTLPRGTKIQVESAVNGLDATVYRVFKQGDKTIKRERFDSHYKPWAAMYKVGTK